MPSSQPGPKDRPVSAARRLVRAIVYGTELRRPWWSEVIETTLRQPGLLRHQPPKQNPMPAEFITEALRQPGRGACMRSRSNSTVRLS